MNLLLDTQALVWLTDINKHKALGKNTFRLIESSSIIYFSSISIVELTIKSMLGKGRKITTAQATEGGLVPMDFKGPHAEVIDNFQSLMRHDPFDRMLLAQAQTENLIFLTADKTLLSLKLPFVVDAAE